MLDYQRARTKPVAFRALSGMDISDFDALLPSFVLALTATEAETRQKNNPQRQAGGGRKSRNFSNPAQQLFSILFYFRHYPTQEVLGFLSHLSQS